MILFNELVNKSMFNFIWTTDEKKNKRNYSNNREIQLFSSKLEYL